MRPQQEKKKLSLYLTIAEKALLDKLSGTWELSNNQAVIKAIKIAINAPIPTFEAIPTPTPTPTPTDIPTPTPSVTVGLSREDIELLIDERIELLVNSRIDSLEVQGEEIKKN